MNGSSSQYQRPDEKSGLAIVSPDLRGSQVGTLINNVIVVCLMCFGGRVKKLRTLIRTCVHFLRFLHHTRTSVPAHAQRILGQSVQSSALLFQPMEQPCLSLHQAYHAQPFILQKETSAQWEKALIIHDHLTIQDLVCVAYVALHISVWQPHLIMVVSVVFYTSKLCKKK